MDLKVYAVWDSKVELYAQPFCLKSEGQALRSWIDAVNDPNTMMNRHPQDYCLFQIAEYNEDKGMFENLRTPKSLGYAIDFIREKKGLSPTIVPGAKPD